jgi:nucleotide-binding universal stress UspA family protein
VTNYSSRRLKVFQKILVPLDGSKLAEVALPYAEELAGRLGSEIILIYINESSDAPDEHMHKFYLEKIAETVKEAAELYDEKSSKRQEIQVKSAIVTGNPAKKIVEYADKEGIGLIVMSTHGRSGITRWTLGSVANKVVQAAKQPMALIRAKGNRSEMRAKGILKKILVPLDGSKEGEIVIPYIVEFAQRLKAEVTLLQVVEISYPAVTDLGYSYIAYTEKQMASDKAFAQNYIDKVVALLKEKGVTATSEVRLKIGNAAEEIINAADETHSDLVVMATHGRSGIGRWVLGSVAERVLHQGNTPLILVSSTKS